MEKKKPEYQKKRRPRAGRTEELVYIYEDHTHRLQRIEERLAGR